MAERLTAGELEELERLEKAATPVVDDNLMRHDHGGGRLCITEPGRERQLIADFFDEANREFFMAMRLAAPALLAAARENAALRRECKVVRKVKEYKEGQERVVRGRCGVAALTAAANLVDEAVAEQEAARAETDRLGALEGE